MNTKDKELENKLQQFVKTSSNAEARNKWAMEWKESGKKVVGWIDPYVPEELIYAAGMLPFRLAGTWRGSLTKALEYRPVNSDVYYTRILESQLLGELDFIDLVVTTNGDEDQRRLYDVLVRLRPACIIFIPRTTTESALNEWERSLFRLKALLEEIGGQKITDQTLGAAIEACNKKRALMRKLYELRKRSIPPLTGTEFFGVTSAALVMPVFQFNKELEALLPYLEERKAEINVAAPRLMVSSDALDHPGYIKIIEETGSLVAMDDFNTGSRYFWQPVDVNGGDLVKALVKRDASRPATSQMVSWPEQIDQVVQWAREYHIDGVIELMQVYSYPREFRSPLLNRELNQVGIPTITISREYHLANVGQLQTRVGAFIETLLEG